MATEETTMTIKKRTARDVIQIMTVDVTAVAMGHLFDRKKLTRAEAAEEIFRITGTRIEPKNLRQYIADAKARNLARLAAVDSSVAQSVPVTSRIDEERRGDLAIVAELLADVEPVRTAPASKRNQPSHSPVPATAAKN